MKKFEIEGRRKFPLAAFNKYPLNNNDTIEANKTNKLNPP